ncbi:MAG: hypothetical protein QOE14_1413 [Humisphaera sp.]|nr:hypothetical protein [Humisphaera sp.]
MKMIRFFGVALLACSLAAAPATQPSTGSLEIRASQAFNAGQYALALPLLQKLEKELAADPAKLGPVQERIRVAQQQVERAAKKNNTSVEAILEAAAPAPSAEQRIPHKKPQPGEVKNLQIKDLGNFDYDADKGGNIPADVLALNGTTVRLNGFMIPIDQAENITSFALVPSLFACCFGQPPQVQHTVVCKAPAGKAVGYYPDELVVEGKLKVEEKKDDGFIISVFEIDVSSVKPAVK